MALLPLMSAFCHAAGHQEHREHGAHVHGIGHVNLAVDGNEVYIELENPAANIVGFEHMPSSAEQSNAVREAAEVLEDGERLFIFSGPAGCSLTSAAVSSPLLNGDHEQGHHHTEAREEKHGGHKHVHEEEHADHEGDVHSEFAADYQFSCKHPKELRSVETTLFSVFPGIEKLEAQILTPRGQAGAELTAQRYRIDF